MSNIHYACAIPKADQSEKEYDTMSQSDKGYVSLTSTACGYSHNRLDVQSMENPDGGIPPDVAVCVQPVDLQMFQKKIRLLIAWIGEILKLH